MYYAHGDRRESKSTKVLIIDGTHSRKCPRNNLGIRHWIGLQKKVSAAASVAAEAGDGAAGGDGGASGGGGGGGGCLIQ